MECPQLDNTVIACALSTSCLCNVYMYVLDDHIQCTMPCGACVLSICVCLKLSSFNKHGYTFEMSYQQSGDDQGKLTIQQDHQMRQSATYSVEGQSQQYRDT